MPNYKIIKMTNMSPMHIGLGRDSYDVSAGALYSDTLTAALASLRALRGKDGDLKQFLESFALSSAFPYCGDTLFLPKPSGRINVEVEGIEKAEDNFLSPMVSMINQRVAVPREDCKNADPFAFEWTYFRKDCGLYCLLDASSDVASEVEDLFNELGEQGIGSDRNVGGGHFGVDAKGNFEMPDMADANGTMLLSMYIPTEQELTSLNVETSRYQLIKRGGYIAGSSNDNLRHLRKNAIYMFTAGSVFNGVAPIDGKVIDLRPAWKDSDLHPVYRSGRALSINIKTDWQ